MNSDLEDLNLISTHNKPGKQNMWNYKHGLGIFKKLMNTVLQEISCWSPLGLKKGY